MFVKILALIAIAVPMLAQEGHPLVGSWHGTWGPNAKERTDVTLVMNWDGKTISGMINPGPDVARFQTATLEPSGWVVHFEADAKDRSGKTVRVVIDGKIEDVTNVRRSISGTWTQGGVKGDFKVVRDN
jgi:hypothetical protein